MGSTLRRYDPINGAKQFFANGKFNPLSSFMLVCLVSATSLETQMQS